MKDRVGENRTKSGWFGRLCVVAVVVATAASIAAPARAQGDEIQVYDGGLAEPGVFNLTIHNNFMASASNTPAFPGALVPNKSFNGVFEWAYGVTDWFEAGLYLPLYSISKQRGASINGGKLRLLFARPHADDHTFFYGANFEFSYNAKHWDERRYTAEIRPIIGVHLHPWDLIFNPILDHSWAGGFGSLEFAPATRIAYNLSPMTAVAIEEYADYGELRGFLPGREQGHQLFGVYDRSTKFMDVEVGAGFGLTHGSDKFTLKLILSRDLNKRSQQ